MMKMEYELLKGLSMLKTFNKIENKYDGNFIYGTLAIIYNVHGSRWGDFTEDLYYKDRGLLAKMPWTYIYDSRSLYLPVGTAYVLLPLVQSLWHGVNIFRHESFGESLSNFPQSPFFWSTVDLKMMDDELNFNMYFLIQWTYAYWNGYLTYYKFKKAEDEEAKKKKENEKKSKIKTD